MPERLGDNNNTMRTKVEKKTQPKAPETPDSKNDLANAMEKRNKDKEKIFADTRSELQDLRKSISTESRVQSVVDRRDNIVTRFDEGIITDIDGDVFESKIATINSALDKRLTQEKQWSYSTEAITKARAKASDLIDNTDVSLQLEKTITPVNQKWDITKSDPFRDIRDVMSELSNDKIHALWWEKQVLDKGTWTLAMDSNAAWDRARNTALHTQWSGWIDTKPMSQPKDMRTAELPKIPVQSIHSESADKVLAEQKAQKKAQTSSPQFASN